MDDFETGKIMAVFAVVYRDFYKGRDPKHMLSIWHGVLQDIPYAAANAAALAYIRTEHFPPVPADIAERAQSLMGEPDMTETEAWALVSRAVRRTDWMAPEKQYDKLPPNIQRVLGSPSTLVEWGKVDSQTFGTVVASNFQRSYRAKRASERELRAIPASVREALKNLKLKELPDVSAEKPDL